MKMCPCCSLNWWAFCYPKCPARGETVTRLDALGGKLEQKRLKPLVAVYTLIPWRKMVTLENVPKFLAYFVRQMGFFRTSILNFFTRLFCFWWWECLLKSEVTFFVFASFYDFFFFFKEGYLFYFFFFWRNSFIFFYFLFIYLFIFGCVGSSFLCEGFL